MIDRVDGMVLKYHLFFGSEYYPKGGMADYKGSYYTLEDAQQVVNRTSEYSSCDWANVAQTQPDGTIRTVARFERFDSPQGWEMVEAQE